MSNLVLAKKDIVTDTNEDSAFYGKQGEVVRVYPNGTVMVRFPVFMLPLGLFMPWEAEVPVNKGYKKHELLKLQKNDNWNEKAKIEWRIKRVWRHMCSVYHLPHKTLTETECCGIKDCTQKPIDWALINFVGTVFVIAMCKNHHNQWNNRALEYLPKLKIDN